MKPDAIPMFDSHSHLQMAVFASDLPGVLERARQEGLEGAVVVGMDPPSSQQAIDLASRYEAIYATVGVHPHDASCLDPYALQSLRELARRPGVVAVGETGLDFYRNLSPPAMQRRAFHDQLTLADELRVAGGHSFAAGERGHAPDTAGVGRREAGGRSPSAFCTALRATWNSRRSTSGWGSCYHSPET